MTIGQRIVRLRRKAGLTQVYLTAKVGVAGDGDALPAPSCDGMKGDLHCLPDARLSQ